jgi:hypothetical protein
MILFFYLKRDVSETVHEDPEIGTSLIDWAQLSRL